MKSKNRNKIGMFVQKVKFSSLNVDEHFFDSLREDYPEFLEWFHKKRDAEAYVSRCQMHGHINGFLYLKVENEVLDDMDPSFGAKKRLKLGTFKVDAHGTKLGDKFVKRLCDEAREHGVSEIYVTIFDKHEGLIRLLSNFGFKLLSRKLKKTENGHEGVYFKNFG